MIEEAPPLGDIRRSQSGRVSGENSLKNKIKKIDKSIDIEKSICYVIFIGGVKFI